MIDHISIKVSDLEKSKKFYEKAFAPLGYKISFGEAGVFYAFDLGKGFLFEIVQIKDKSQPTSVQHTGDQSSKGLQKTLGNRDDVWLLKDAWVSLGRYAYH